MNFSELKIEELYEVNGGCGLCTVGGIIGGAGTVGAVVAMFTPAAPLIIIGCVVGGAIGYWITT
nr:bacteriocin [Clostridia bacterium]